jgi:F-type H+-transporting ATPase subunit delta
MKISPVKYAQLIYESTKDLEKKEIGGVLEKIVSLIREKGDGNKTDQIIEEFNKIYNRQEGIVEAEITSRKKLSSRDILALKKNLSEKFKTDENKVFIKNIENMGIKGGLIIQVGNEIFDGSVKSRLERLKMAITK